MVLCAVKTLVLFLCICCLGVWCSGDIEEEADGSPMKRAEQAALYSAIQGFVGDWWNGSDLYPDPCGWTPIQGVSCDIYDGFWYVTSLSFGPVHDNSLVCGDNAEFRTQLFELKHLKSLSFFNCFKSSSQYLTTTPKENWLKLSGSLESLEFRSNAGLTGELPSVVTSLTKLQSLVISDNGLTGELPADIGKLTKLKRLVLSGNHFTGDIPDVGWLSGLLILDLSRNSLSGSLPLSIGELTSLLKLDLSNNFLEGKIPKEIGILKNLTLLDLRNNRFSGGLTQEIQNISSLEELVLSDNLFGGSLMNIQWEKLTNLVVLDLSNLGITGEIPLSIVELSKLRFLGLNNNSLTGNLLPEIENMPCLGALYINENNITGELQFSKMFYLKMGRRFGAWGNPNLCSPLKEASNRPHAPFGVNLCKHKEVKLLQPNSQTLIWNKKSDSNPSLGLASSVSIGIFLVQGLMAVLFLI